MSALRVYVAGASAEVDMCASYIERLRDAGVVITHDWTVDVRAARDRGEQDSGLAQGRRLACATSDLHGVGAADVLWKLVPASPSEGASSELGYALGIGTPAIVSGPYRDRCIFTELCKKFAEHEEAFAHLVERAASMRSALS